MFVCSRSEADVSVSASTSNANKDDGAQGSIKESAVDASNGETNTS